MNKKCINGVIIKDDYVLKNKNERLIELYEYFDSVDFTNHPKIIDYDDKNIRSEFIKESKYYEISKGIEFIKTVAILHKKTISYKSVSKNKYRKIYDKISGNIEFLKEYYKKIINVIEEEEYMSPSHYLFARNYSLIDSSLKYASNNLKKWFKMVENKDKERVCIIHNNLSLKHFIKGDKNYLISFDNYLVDTPVLDLYKFYKKEGYKLDFKLLLDEYNNNFTLLEEEKMLLNILISIPPKIKLIDDEYYNCIELKNHFDYIKNGVKIVS